MKTPDTASWQSSNCVSARTGILLVAHAPLARAYVAVAQHVFGDIAGPLVALDIHPNATPDTVIDAACELVAAMCCQEVLVLVDIHGGPTPCVIARRVCDALGTRADLIGGVNMPMLLTAIEGQQGEVHVLAAEVADCGRRSVLAGLPA